MSGMELNRNDLGQQVKNDEIELRKARTLKLMFEGARAEQRKFDEMKKLRVQLKEKLECLLLLQCKPAGIKKAKDTLEQLEKYGKGWDKKRLENALEYFSNAFLHKYLKKL